MPGGSIDLNGTTDALVADVSAIGTTGVVFAQGAFRYEVGLNNRTILYFSDSGGSGDAVHLYKNGATLNLDVTDASGPASTNVNLGITINTWTWYQLYAGNAAAGGVGLRIWTTGLPGAFTTGTGRSISVDALVLGYNGTGEFFNGQIAETYVTTYSPAFGPPTTADFDAVVDSMAATGNPQSVLTPLYQHLVIDNGVNLGCWWRMQDASQLIDVFNGAALSVASGAPTTANTSPRFVMPGRLAG